VTIVPPSASPDDPAPSGTLTATSRWWTKRSIVAHVALVIWVPGCVVAARWQVGIALGGNSLGWVYSVMWPCFAVFAIVFWWFLVHDDPDTLGSRGLARLAADGDGTDDGGGAKAHAPVEAVIAKAEAEDPELAAYNAYLAALSDQSKTWRQH
jgi:hypothetical protein